MRPRIDHAVLISLDTLRGDVLGPNRFEHVGADLRASMKLNSHVLDDFAATGVRFKNCFSAAPFTTASHASVFTGFMPLHHGVYEYFNAAMRKKTLFEYAAASGFETIMQTDFPMILGQPIGFTRGINKYFIEDEEGALRALKEQLSSRTMSLFHFGGIHYPYGFHTLKFGGNDYRRKVEMLERECGITDAALPRDQFDEARRSGEDRELLLRYKRVIEHLYERHSYERLFQLYFEGVDYFLEHRFRPFLENLRALFVGTNSLIVLFGDHGEDWSGESKGHYKSLTPGVLHVPLIFAGTGILPNTVSRTVRTIDIAPTILDMLHIKNTEQMDGELLPLKNSSEDNGEDRMSIAQVWLGVGKQELISHIERAHRECRFVEKITTVKRGESIIKGDYQYARFFDKNGNFEREILESFSGQGVPKAVRNASVEALDAYNRTKVPDGPGQEPDGAVREQLRAMGYNV